MQSDLDAEFSRFIEIYSIDKAERDMNSLGQVSEHFDVSESCAALSLSLIRQAIDDQEPFSLVRVGDGEGNILAGSAKEFPHLSEHSEREILRMMFGSERFSPDQVDCIRAGLIEAIVGADILGVSDAARLKRMRLRLASGQKRLDVRGLSGTIESIVGVRRVVELA